MHSIQYLAGLLKQPRRIVITTHHKPDGDALGSSLGLCLWLNKQGHEAVVIAPSDYPDFLEWLPGEKEVLIYPQRMNHAEALIARAELFFCLDFNKLYRANEVGALIGKQQAPKVLIDHHLEPDHFADYELWTTGACSTAELVYELIRLLGGLGSVDRDIATCIYTGILTDTNTFRTNNTTPAVHRLAAELMEHGIDAQQIYSSIYETYTENRLRLLGHCITERMEILPELRTGIISLGQEDLQRYNIQTGDTEGIVNFPLNIGTVDLAVLIVQRPDQVKLSMRSKGSLDVNELCKNYFEGGGHRNAAGGKSNVSVEETKKNLITILARLSKNNHAGKAS